MTTNNGWPGKPGVPLNPEEPGYHWVKGCDGEDTIVFWRGHGGDTHYENGDLKKLDHWSGHPMWIAQEWTYLGPVPVLTPNQVAALQKRVAELEGAQARLILSLRLNMLRFNPQLSHEAISKTIEVALIGAKDE